MAAAIRYLSGLLSKRNLPWLPALGLSDWFTNLLRRNDFTLHQHIVTLERETAAPLKEIKPNPAVFIRLMQPEDLDRVAEIDQLAFEPIWQNSLSQIKLSYDMAVYATVAEINDQIVGFQISTSTMFSSSGAVGCRPRCNRNGLDLHW